MHSRGVGDWELEETGGAAVGTSMITQVSDGFVDAGEYKGALRGCCGSESCQVVGVFTSFSPDGLELGQGRP